MRGPAAAIAWELRQRHRRGLLAALAAILILGAIKVAVLLTRGTLQVSEATFALLVPVPLAAMFIYLLAVFTFGIAGDLGARDSMYPRRMLTLPVSTAALAGWPMSYGCASMALLWCAMRIGGIFPPGVEVPKYWPALFAASLLAWTQALTWMPYPLRGMRIAISIALLVSIDVVVFTALQTRASESRMLLLLAPSVPLAYATAVTAVGRARRGDVPDWGAARRSVPGFAKLVADRDFRSASRAQLWFEWRQHGRSLPLMVAIVLPPGLLLLAPFRDTPVVVIEVVVLALLMPPFLAIFAAATIGRSSSNPSDSYGITPFIATRPVEDRALVVAKWQAAALSTLAAWLIVAVTVPLALLWAQATEPIMEIAGTVDDALGRPRAIILGLFVLAALAASTWKQLVQGLYVSMSGRDRAVKGMVFGTLVTVTAGFFALGWILDSRQRSALAWSSIPWLMAGLVALKLIAALGVMHHGVARALFTRRQLVAGALIWDLCVFAVFGVLALILPAILVRRHLLLLVAMIVVPFVRLAAAPLAVAKDRHR